ncbi:MAG: ABC transporter ATP-binding protein [Candidatus Dormibacteraeota bacterium]|nr:ABC transporter ATP-binding protein [Candidatus Dormibacteraeota bacterium]
MTAVLRAEDISVSFGGVRALVDVSLEVPEGKLVGMIGPNGAGKTTFIDAISGFVGCSGEVELDGRRVSSLPPHARARRGLARTWQSIELFDDLTVRENLAVASHRPSLWEAAKELVSNRPRHTQAMEEALGVLGVDSLVDVKCTDLPQGQRKLVGVARALATKPRLICLDEPAAGLATQESDELGKRLRDVVDAGTSMLLVDHDMGLVLGVCDYVVVLEFGKVIAQGPPDAVRKDPQVVKAYLGSAAAEVAGEATEASS